MSNFIKKNEDYDTETQKWLLVSGSVVMEKAVPVKVALKAVSEGQNCNI
jgi:hypothetical protein